MRSNAPVRPDFTAESSHPLCTTGGHYFLACYEALATIFCDWWRYWHTHDMFRDLWFKKWRTWQSHPVDQHRNKLRGWSSRAQSKSWALLRHLSTTLTFKSKVLSASIPCCAESETMTVMDMFVIWIFFKDNSADLGSVMRGNYRCCRCHIMELGYEATKISNC